MDNTETWEYAAGFEDFYEVSDHGRVRNLFTEKLRKPSGAERRHVALFKHGKRYEVCIGVLVLTTFVGPRPQGMLGLHRDDNPTNNRLSNLYWGTGKENSADALKNGACRRGPIWVTGDISRVLDLKAAGLGVMSITRYLGLSQHFISRVFHGERFGLG